MDSHDAPEILNYNHIRRMCYQINDLEYAKKLSLKLSGAYVGELSMVNKGGEEANVTMIREALHKIRGGAKQLGATRLAAKVEQLNDLDDSALIAQYKDVYLDIESLIVTTCKSLESVTFSKQNP